MSDLPVPYIVTWVSALLLAIVQVLGRPARYVLVQRRYLRFLAQPWKLASGAAAIALLIVVAPYSGDPTWDAPDSILTGVLTIWTAPWSVGLIARAFARRRWDPRIPIAIVAFFVPCFAYDVYIWVRDGFYAPGWLPNLVLSGGVCLLAGLFFNLEGGERSFAFSRRAWPPRSAGRFGAPWGRAVILAAPVALLIGAFVFDTWAGF